MSMIELKLDADTMFEWQKHSQGSTEVPEVPHFSILLEFLNLRAQASESSVHEFIKKCDHGGSKNFPFNASFSTVVEEQCNVCKSGKHYLYACPKFKSLPHEEMMSILKSNHLCMNCLKHGHFASKCPSNQKCRKCQKPHHTLLHLED